MNSGYAGTVAQARSLTVSGGFTTTGGTWTAGSQTLTISGSFTMNAGSSFTASSGTTTFATAFTINGGTFTHNSGLVTFSGTLATLTCNNITFNRVTFTNTSTKTVGTTCSLPLGSDPILTNTGTITLNGTLSGTGTLTFNGTNQQLTASSTAAISGFSGLFFQRLTMTGATLDFSSASSFVVNGSFNMTSSATLSVPVGADFNSTFQMTVATFNAPAGNISIGGIFSLSGTPVFNANGGTVTFDTAVSTATFSCKDVVFSKVVLALTSDDATIGTDCTFPLGNNPTLSGSTIYTMSGFLTGTGTLTVSNPVVLEIGSNNAITGFSAIDVDTISIAGNADFSSLSSFIVRDILTYYIGTLSLPSGADIATLSAPNASTTIVAPAGSIYVESLAITAVTTFTTNNGTVVIDGANGSVECSGAPFYLVQLVATNLSISADCTVPVGSNVTSTSNVSLSGTLSGSGTLTLASLVTSGGSVSGLSGLTTTGNLQQNTGTSTFSSLTTMTVGGNFIQDTGTFVAPAGTLNVAGNWTNNGGTFTHSNGTVNLTGSSKVVSGSSTFYNLTKTTSSADTLTFTAGTTQTIANILTMQGASGNLLSLRSSANGSQWNIDPQGTRTIGYLDVRDSQNVNATTINAATTGSTDSGNNTGWIFAQNVMVPTTLGSAAMTSGRYISDTTPTLTFTLTDSVPANTSKYQIQIDDNADFSSPVVDYTSALAAQGTFSFTVGQDAGSGTYSVGASGQTLSDGNYYWRVKSTNSQGGVSAYQAANSGNVAFIIDTVAPTAPTLQAPASGSYWPTKDPTFVFAKASDAASGIEKYEIIIDPNSVQEKNYVGVIDVGLTITENSATRFIEYGTTTIAARTKEASTFLSEGYHTLRVIAFDHAGNTTNSDSNLYIDLTAPVLPSVSLKSQGLSQGYAVTTQTQPDLTAMVTDNLAADKLTVSIYRQNFVRGVEVARSLLSTENFVLPSQTDMTSVTLKTAIQKKVEYGKYIFEFSGIDKAGHSSRVVILKVNVVAPQKVTSTLQDTNSTPDVSFSLPEIIKNIVSAPQLPSASDTPSGDTLPFTNLQSLETSVGSDANCQSEGVSILQQVRALFCRFQKYPTIALALFHSYVFDTQPTRITNVAITNISDAEALITWETNHYAENNKVNFGQTLSYGDEAWGKNGQKKHQVRITNLESKTLYYFEVMSQRRNYAYDAHYTFSTQ